MPDSLYVIDVATPSLVELPATIPSLLTYTLRQQPTNSSTVEVMQNFTGEELAVLYVQARVSSLNGLSATTHVSVAINWGTAFASVVVPAVSASSTSFAPLWSADLADPPLLGATDLLSASGNGADISVDICMIPSSQLSLLGS